MPFHLSDQTIFYEINTSTTGSFTSATSTLESRFTPCFTFKYDIDLLIFVSQGGPTIEQRFESYYNYCKLFNYILSAEAPVNLELPNQWLWEIIDEFIYQFQVNSIICDFWNLNILCQAFSQFRSKLAKKTEDEIETLKRNPKVIFCLASLSWKTIFELYFC